ncbi:MAG: AraC family transcriptional regulator [Verrucomicrobiota bacterium]|nr:AraC family transcriptional regulator [Verrucomicrobiota bacterium]
MQTSVFPSSIRACDHFLQSSNYHQIRKEGSEDWLIFYTLSGHGVFAQNKTQVFCGPGDVNIYQPKHYQNYKTFGKGWRFLWAHFSPPESWLRWLNLPHTPIQGLLSLHVRRTNNRQKIERAMKRMLAYDRMPSFHKGQLIMNALEESLLWISEANPNLRDINRDDRVEKALEIITSSFNEKHTVENLARTIGLSPSRFAHLFKEQTGRSVIDTIIDLRLAESAKLLEFTSFSIKSISIQTGFQNPYYFSRLFSQKYGRSPKVHRQSCLQDKGILSRPLRKDGLQSSGFKTKK